MMDQQLEYSIEEQIEPCNTNKHGENNCWFNQCVEFGICERQWSNYKQTLNIT